MNNQKEQKYLPRDEFEKYIDSLSIDKLKQELPERIKNHEWEWKLWQKSKHIYDFWYRLRGWRDYRVIMLRNITWKNTKEKVKNMLLRLYDNWHLPQYSEKSNS